MLDVVRQYKGKELSANLPYKVAFQLDAEDQKPKKFFAHLVGPAAHTTGLLICLSLQTLSSATLCARACRLLSGKVLQPLGFLAAVRSRVGRPVACARAPLPCGRAGIS